MRDELPAKPSWVYARDFEWESLAGFAAAASPRVRLGVVSGRRRQGKTFLLRALAEATGAFYYAAAETTTADSLRDLGAALAAHTGAAAPYAIREWGDALRVISETVRDGLAIIDEFPYLTRSDPALPSLLQRALDDRAWGSIGGRERGTRFLLCGSAMSVMGELLAGNAPLRGRSSLELLVAPFDHRTAARFWGIDDDPALAVLVHSIVGGTPAYRSEFIADDVPTSREDFDDWVVRTVLNPAVPLFREARYLLAEETDIREPALYNSVLGAIAGGNATRGGIANYVGRKSSEVMHPLNVLEDARLITRESDPFHARKSLFRNAEPLISFYEAVMRPAWAQLEQRQARAVWQRQRPAFLSGVVGPHFESLCRTWAAGVDPDVFGDFPAQVAAAAVSDPANRTQIEVDVVVLASGTPEVPRRVLSLGEAKWGEVMGVGHLERLRRARDLLSAKGHRASDAVLACYSGAGFTPDLHALAQADPHILLVDLERLYQQSALATRTRRAGRQLRLDFKFGLSSNVTTMTFTEVEQRFMARIGRGHLATVAPNGTPQVKPLGFTVNAELGTIDIVGMNMAASAKYRNVQANPHVAFVVDEVTAQSVEGAHFLEIRGEAETVTGPEDPTGHLAPEIIRIHPRRIISFNVDPDHPGFATRDVTPASRTGRS